MVQLAEYPMYSSSGSCQARPTVGYIELVKVACESCSDSGRLDEDEVLVIGFGVLRKVVTASDDERVINDQQFVVHEILFASGIEAMRGSCNEARVIHEPEG